MIDWFVCSSTVLRDASLSTAGVAAHTGRIGMRHIEKKRDGCVSYQSNNASGIGYCRNTACHGVAYRQYNVVITLSGVAILDTVTPMR